MSSRRRAEVEVEEEEEERRNVGFSLSVCTLQSGSRGMWWFCH